MGGVIIIFYLKFPEIRHCFASKSLNLGGKSSSEFVGTRLGSFIFKLSLTPHPPAPNSNLNLRFCQLKTIRKVSIMGSFMVNIMVSQILTKNSFKSGNGLFISPFLRDFLLKKLSTKKKENLKVRKNKDGVEGWLWAVKKS